MIDHKSMFRRARLATAPGSRSRPTVVVTTDFAVWLGNESGNEIKIKNTDVFGFHSGEFETKPVSGTSGSIKYISFFLQILHFSD